MQKIGAQMLFLEVNFCLEFRDTFIRRGTNGGYLPTLNTISKTFTTKAAFLDALEPPRIMFRVYSVLKYVSIDIIH